TISGFPAGTPPNTGINFTGIISNLFSLSNIFPSPVKSQLGGQSLLNEVWFYALRGLLRKEVTE
ncbi:MAG: hypothetical protein N2202_10005, partial [Proteobacteria bacterium]|nr:hypothetical protein [Pseudomonadota bacterium]